ncbi:hypothetical protein GFB49_14165 [Epibacterium sp. SM1979]|uniref:Sulfotransferase family protein n=1 Tax=Tritonibacter litoralis TaxID=2662264 RepID=A0A843YKB3_9RHOB|nr:hypothetical protein [Tritonibacter litoralis]MQQ09609.1 hypothetical protein [Tritonibacter litoralis]
MKIIFYIGHHKVGSTALQAFLAENWRVLIKNGILYPSIEGHGFAANLRQALQKDPIVKEPIRVREPHSALAYRMIADVSGRPIPRQFSDVPPTDQMIRAIRSQVTALQPETVVLCSEAFSNFGQVDANLVTVLRDIFPDAEMQVYCALRRPDQYITSWHGQRLKVGEKNVAPLHETGAAQYYGTIHFDYAMVVNAWVDHMPEAQLTLRNYADILAAGGSIEDFVAQTGLALPQDGISPPGRANESLPLAAFSIMAQATQALQHSDTLALSRFLQTKGKALSPVANGDIEVFGADHRAKLVEDFAPIDARLAEIQGTSAFFADLDAALQPRSTPILEAGRALLDAIDPDSLPNPELKTFIETLKRDL